MSPQINQSVSDKESPEVSNAIVGEDVSTNLKTADIGTDLSYTHKILWINVIVGLVHHSAALLGFIYVITIKVHPLTAIYLIILSIIQLFGLTMGAHRYFAHRSFKATPALRRTLFILYVLNGHYPLWTWIRDHRQHHKYADTDGDRYNATRGLFFSQIGWLMCESNPTVCDTREKIDTSDIDADPWIMFEHNNFVKVYLVQLILTWFTPVILWNENVFKAFCVCYALRTFMGLHMISASNSLAHTFGTKPYDKSLRSTQNMFAAFLGFGEGWHNFHHAFPYDYRASEEGMIFNWTANLIDFCAKMGWVYDRKEASDKILKSRIIRTGDNSHEKYGNVLRESEVK